MYSGLSPAYERAITLVPDGQIALTRIDALQKTTEPKPRKNAGKSLLLRFLYWIYERRLVDQIKRQPMPRHIGIILDGNRRHARKQRLSEPCEIYQRGAEKLDDVLNWSAELHIPAVTLWVFSTENRTILDHWKSDHSRPPSRVTAFAATMPL